MPLLWFRGADYDLVCADVEYLTPEQEGALLDSAHPESRASLARNFERMRMRQRRLMAAATPEQIRIGWGAYFALKWDGRPDSLLRGDAVLPACTIYGRVYTRAQARQAEYATGASPAEVGRVMRELDVAYSAGWRHVRAYSDKEPGGEIGDQHVALMIPVSMSQFRHAQTLGWPEDIPGE